MNALQLKGGPLVKESVSHLAYCIFTHTDVHTALKFEVFIFTCSWIKQWLGNLPIHLELQRNASNGWEKPILSVLSCSDSSEVDCLDWLSSPSSPCYGLRPRALDGGSLASWLHEVDDIGSTSAFFAWGCPATRNLIKPHAVPSHFWDVNLNPGKCFFCVCVIVKEERMIIGIIAWQSTESEEIIT